MPFGWFTSFADRTPGATRLRRNGKAIAKRRAANKRARSSRKRT